MLDILYTHGLALESLDNSVPLGQVVVDSLELLEGFLGQGDSLLVLEDRLVVRKVDLWRSGLERRVLVDSSGVSSSEGLEGGERLLS